ncbi:MAG: aminotransferase class I/II-fold pyridoxal phosphate-dependent enzyme [Pseudomonadota bacterium]
MRKSNRSDVAPFIVMDIMEAARKAEAAGRHIIHMEVGQPGTPAPERARLALADAMNQGSTLGYTTALGLQELRDRIAGLYRTRHGLEIDPGRVIVTAGASGAFILAFSALFDAGDQVALGVPAYPSYRQILSAMSLLPVGLPTDISTRFQPTVPMIPGDVAGLIVASPSNPAGTMLDRPSLSALIERCDELGAAFISDEIYHGLDFGMKAVSALEISDDVFVINSFSKYFSMTGWRLGWMIVPESHIRVVDRLAQNMFICPPHASQVAGCAAFDAVEELEANRAVYAKNRDLLMDALPKAGFTKLAPPDGAFYIYADISDLTDDSMAFAADILDKVGVAVTPGVDFDADRGQTTLRLSYAGSTADIKEGIERLARYMGSP